MAATNRTDVSAGDPPDADRAPSQWTVEDPRVIDEIIRYRAALEAGEPVDRQELLRRFPEAAADIARCLNALDFVHHIAPQVSESLGDAEALAAQAAGPPVLGTLGDFRIIRQIGSGGMGVVYEAEQISLGRRVALKVLPFAAVLDSRQLQRFKNEAHAAAMLDHPGIVHVYAVGCDRAVHYYAMQYVEGQTLAAIIRQWRDERVGDEREGDAAPRLPSDDPNATSIPAAAEHTPKTASPSVNRQAEAADTRPARAGAGSTRGSTRDREFFRKAAELGVQAAQAVEYAHQMGVIHRDIKPSNLLVDARGHLWVADFGLATTRDSGELTLSGDILGTLRYMSPEQATGNRRAVDHRTDIYALGVTLYEMLTLAAPFDSDPNSLRRRIAVEEPRPLRQHDPHIPRDLETIVLKAIAKEPQARYATAGEFGDDLRRFLEDRPIVAKRPSLGQRAGKWIVRHRALVAAVVAVMLVAVVGLAAALVEIAARRSEAVRARNTAQKQRQYARQAVDEMYTQFAEEWLAEQPGLTAVQRKFLERSLEYYQTFAEEDQEDYADEATNCEAAKAYRRCGDVQSKLGDYLHAEHSYRRAIRQWTDVADRAPLSPEQREDLAASWHGLAAVLYDADWGRSKSDYSEIGRRALAIRRELMKENLAEPRYRFAVAASCTFLGGKLAMHGGFAEAAELLHEARTILAALVTAAPAQAAYGQLLVEALYHASRVEGFQQHIAEASALADDAVTRSRALRKQFPKKLAGCGREALRDDAFLLARQGKFERADEVMREAIALGEQLVRDYPEIPLLKREVGVDWDSAAQVALVRGDRPTARRCFEKAVAQFELSCRESMHDAYGRFLLSDAYMALVDIHDRLQEHAEMRRARERFLAATNEGIASAVNEYVYAPVLAFLAYSFLADPDPKQRNAVRAKELADKAVELAPNQAWAVGALGASYYRLGQFQDAENTLNDAARVTKGTTLNTNRLDDYQLENRMYRVMASIDLGETEFAQKLFAQAMDEVERIKKTDRKIHTRTLRLIDETRGRFGPAASPAKPGAGPPGSKTGP